MLCARASSVGVAASLRGRPLYDPVFALGHRSGGPAAP
jgi:hypothetical protein